MKKQCKTAALAAIHETAQGMYEAKVIAKETMKEFEEMCVIPVRKAAQDTN